MTGYGTMRPNEFIAGWKSGLPETPCGFGSKISATEVQRRWIPEIVKKYEIETVADIGAGDLNWVKLLDWDVNYSAYDLVPRTPEVIVFDITKEIPPAVDMIMCLWVINHLPYEDKDKAITNILLSGSRYLMISDRPTWGSIFSTQPLEMITCWERDNNIKLFEINDG